MNDPRILLVVCVLTLVGVVLLLFGVGLNTN